MDLANLNVKKILIITVGVLIAILILINIVKYIQSIPEQITVYPTPIPASQNGPENTFPTLKPDEVNTELIEILNKRAVLSPVEKEAVSSLSANLALHPYRGSDFEISYSPILNLFFIHKKVADADPAIRDFLGNKVLVNMYDGNQAYRLFVISKSSAEYSRYAFERQYNEINSKLPNKK